MEILYGSQNFGYSNSKSDRDWVRLEYPTWDDILNNKIISKTLHTKEGQIKVWDMRSLYKRLTSGFIADLQILYSKQYVLCGDLNWFISNRDKIVRCNMLKSLVSVEGNIRYYLNTDKRQVTPKDVVRSEAFYRCLVRLLEDKTFELEDPTLLEYRNWLESQDKNTVISEANRVKHDVLYLRPKYIAFDEKGDIKVQEQIKLKVLELVKNNLSNISITMTKPNEVRYFSD